MSTSKHLLNSPTTLVVSALESLCTSNPFLRLDSASRVLYLPPQNRTSASNVSLICGGGAGHEPAHAAFVGKGLLTAAVSGSVFASPSASQVRKAVQLASSPEGKGTVIIVKNYTGDVLNFGLAKEHLAAQGLTYVRFVVVGDDVAVGRTQGALVGRRGLAGTVLTYKIAGALAESGASLDEVASIAEWTAENLVSIGVGLEHCHVPGTAVPARNSESHLSTNEIEIGMGIHNESGVMRLSGVSPDSPPPLSEIMPRLVKLLIAPKEEDPERGWVGFAGCSVVLMVNNLGGLSPLELGGILSEARKELEGKGLVVKRVLCGTYMTSLNMPGFSITLLRLPDSSSSDNVSESRILSLLDARAEASGWGWISTAPPVPLSQQIDQPSSSTAESPLPDSKTVKLSASSAPIFAASIKRACEALIKAEPELTRMDTVAGDGDCGLTLKAGASGTLTLLDSGVISGEDVVRSCVAIAGVAEDKMGGTSGGLYSIFFSALAQGLQSSAGQSTHLTSADWTSALQLALAKLYTYTRARPPSRTLVDPLDAFISALSGDDSDSSNVDRNLKKAVESAVDAARATATLEAKAGRAAYVEGGRLKEEQVVDPGAWGVSVILGALAGEEIGTA